VKASQQRSSRRDRDLHPKQRARRPRDDHRGRHVTFRRLRPMRYRTTIIGSALFLLQSLHCGSHAPLQLPVRHRQALFRFCRSSRSLVRLALMLRFSLLTIRREVRRRRTSIRGRPMLMCSKAPWYRKSMMARLKRSLRDRCGPSSRTIIT
jgi:hypothetical protein